MDEDLPGPGQLDGASDNPLLCTQCPETFANWLELESHMKNHKEERPFKCNQCDRSYRHAGSLVNHKKTHQVGLYSCLVCQKEYSNLMGLKNHLRTHSDDKRYKCDECSECFRMSRQLSNHKKASHGFFSATNGEDIMSSREGLEMPPTVLSEHSNVISNLENYIAESMVPSDFSQLTAKYYPEVSTPDLSKKKLKMAPQEEDSEEKEDQVVNSNLEERRYKCKQCGKAYKHAGSLANHRLSHTVGVYQCAICYKEFSNLMAMKNHCRLHSNSRAKQRGEAPYSSRKVSRRSSENHVKPQQTSSSHGDFMEKQDDQQAFSEVSESSHSEEETRITPPYKSEPDCLNPLTKTVKNESYTALNLDSLIPPSNISSREQEEASPPLRESHLSPEKADQSRTLPPGPDATDEESKPGESSEDRPFMCQVCGRTYRHAGSLINHKKTHQTGVYNCSICSKQLFNMAALKNHLRAHFKSRGGRRLEDGYYHSASFSDELFQGHEDAFQCVICREVLASEADFLQHQALHRDEKIVEIGHDKLPAKEEPAPELSWGEIPQGSQGSSDDSAYSSGPGIPEAIKREVENLALQPPTQQWNPDGAKDIPYVDNKEDPVTSFQNPLISFDQSPVTKMVSEETDSPKLEDDTQISDHRPYKCEACGRTYRHKSSLLNHKLTHKTGVYQCSLCPKQYLNLMALRNHLRFHYRTHTGRRNLSKRGRTLLYSKPKLLQGRAGLLRATSRKLDLSNVSYNPGPMADADVNDGSENVQEQPSQACVKPNCSAEETTSAVLGEQCGLTEAESGGSASKEPQGTGTEAAEHPGKKVYRCDLCDKTYRHSGSLINHKRTHQTGDYACPVCSKHVHNLAALKNHLRIHHRVRREKFGDGNDSLRFSYSNMYLSHDRKDLFGCPSCEEIFQSAEDLLAHQDMHMDVERVTWGHLAEDTPLPNSMPEVTKSPDTGDYNDWEPSNQPEEYPENPSDLEESLSSPEEDKAFTFPCDECGVVCTNMEELNTHEQTHHQTGIYQCSFCPKEYPNLLALRTHFQSHKKPQTFRTKSREDPNGQDGHQFEDLESSMDHRYDCGHCGMIFSNEGDFHQHQVGHESQALNGAPHGLSPEEHVPDFDFAMHSSEQELLRRIKNEMEEGYSREAAYGGSHLSHICGFCGKTYDDLESLEAHGLTHADDNVSAAAEGFVSPGVEDYQASNLQQSQDIKEEKEEDDEEREKASGDVTKSGESPDNRPYTCNQCGKTYRHGGSLVNHKKTHLVGNFQCLACFRHYPNLAAYQNHLRHHPKCKQQQAALGNIGEPHALNTADNICLDGNGERLSNGPSVNGSMSTLPDTHHVYEASVPSMAPTSNDHSGLDYSSPQFHPPKNHVRLSSKQPAGPKSARKAVKRRRMLNNHSLCDTGRSTSTTHTQTDLDVEDKSAQVCELCGKLCLSVHEMVAHLASNCDGNKAEAKGSTSSGSAAGGKAESAPSILSIKREVGELGFHQRPFRCEVCGCSYRHAGSLINHKQSHKTGVFRCAICQKRFFNLMAMKNHNRIHFELKRHKCPECGKAFRLRKQLDTHQRIHRDRATEKKPGRHKRRGAKSRKANPLEQKSSFTKALSISASKEATEGAGGSGASPRAPRLTVSKKDPDARPYQCEQCGRSYRHAGSLVNHKKSHTVGQYSCTVCDKTYSNLMAMKNHQRTHYEAKRHHCSKCGKSFRWKRQLSRHQLVHSQELNLLGSKEKEGSPPPSSTVPDHPPKLESCNMSTNKRTCKRPRNIDGVTPQSESASPPSSDHRPPSPLHPVCQDCGILFVSYDELENHTCRESDAQWESSSDFHQNHEGAALDTTHPASDRPYQCNLCGRTYRHAGSLLNHKNTHKTGVYKCSICLKQFFNPMAIKNHLRTHTAEKRFQCLECGKAFRSSRELICHHRVHTGERPFHCPTCNRGFSSKLTLRHHQRTHKKLSSYSAPPQSSSLVLPSDTGMSNSDDDPPVSTTQVPDHVAADTKEERRYKCNQCDRSYRHAGSLLNHRKTHSTGVYQCPDCHKKFYNLLALKNHLRIHRYPCPDCGKAFRIAGHLATHRKVHEQGGPFTCPLCSKGFFCRSMFEQHQLTHSSQKTDGLDPQEPGNLMVEVT